ncbi:MAG: peptidoglycan DD-metalloendopeptidase family protein [Candidatus Sumerlaeota bacterium]|nr:peptidoglycan DD-metalloendopeptidase family protein [Candidatus Sumerlaeota bacterium]
MRSSFYHSCLIFIASFVLLTASALHGKDAGYNTIDACIKSKEYDAAIKLIDERIVLEAQSEALLYRKSVCFYHQKSIDKAGEMIGSLLSLNSKEPAYYNLAGAILLQQEDFSEAITCFYKSLKINSNDPDVWMNLSYTMRRRLYAPPISKYLAVLGKQFDKNLGYKIMMAEFDLSFNRPSSFQKILSEVSDEQIAEPYLKRLSLYARQWSDIKLDRSLLLKIKLKTGENDGIQNLISNDETCLRLIEQLKDSRKSTAADMTSKDNAPQSNNASRFIPQLSTSPINPSPNEESLPSSALYHLPFPYAEARCCAQSVSVGSHESRMQYAVDFYLKPGTPVCAARSGQVVSLCQSNEPQNYTDYGAMIVIAHTGGEYSRYFHLAENSIKVKIGQSVKFGQIIALAGLTSVTRYPVLHFEVAKQTIWWNILMPPPYISWKSIPFKFSELSEMKEELGVPIANRWYVSKNE